MARDIQAEIQKAVTDHEIVLFMKGTPSAPMCGFSAAVVEALSRTGAREKIHGINVLADGEIRNGIKEFSNWPTLPQLFIGGEFVGGCDIALEMEASGELQKAVNTALGR